MTQDMTALDGFDQLTAMRDAGRRAPMGETMNFHMVEVDRGHVVFEGTPDRSVYNPMGSVHGGYAATLLDSACGIAVHSRLAAGQGYTTLELKIPYHRGLSDGSGPVRAVGRVASMGRRVCGGHAARLRWPALRLRNLDAARVRTPAQSPLAKLAHGPRAE